jgi:hypothetical protein
VAVELVVVELVAEPQESEAEQQEQQFLRNFS